MKNRKNRLSIILPLIAFAATPARAIEPAGEAALANAPEAGIILHSSFCLAAFDLRNTWPSFYLYGRDRMLLRFSGLSAPLTIRASLGEQQSVSDVWAFYSIRLPAGYPSDAELRSLYVGEIPRMRERLRELYLLEETNPADEFVLESYVSENLLNFHAFNENLFGRIPSTRLLAIGAISNDDGLKNLLAISETEDGFPQGPFQAVTSDSPARDVSGCFRQP